jgi:DNA-binding beta-propeller fold protein YncE
LPKIYWADQHAGKIQRSNLDGTDVEDIITSLSQPSGIAVDLSGGKLYWTARGSGAIQRANLDGTDIEYLVTGLGEPFDIVIDSVAGRMYWTDIRNNKVQGADLDGGQMDDLVTVSQYDPAGIDIDIPDGRIYWTDAVGSPQPSRIWRCNFDGGGREYLLADSANYYDITLDLVSDRLLWSGNGYIDSANLDGSGVERILSTGGAILGLDIDSEAGKIYWTNAISRSIHRADLDGSNIEDLVTSGLRWPVDISVVVPEPGTVLLLGLGAVVAIRRKQ